MKRIVKTIIIMSAVMLCMGQLVSCEKAYDDLRLDHLWRLDSIEESGSSQMIEDIYWGFSAEAVEIHMVDYYHHMGILTHFDDSIRIDFSPYFNNDEYDPEVITKRLRKYGVEAPCESFHIDELSKSSLTLANRKKTLHFTRF